MDLINFRLTLTGRNRYYEFFPQFVAPGRDGGMQYTPTLREDAHGFIGWMPYFNKKWPLATDKLLFKKYCVENGLRTPRYWTQPDAAVGDVIIKQKASSFGKGIRGPFRTIDSADAEHRLLEKEYYEQFIMGTIAKAWYWDGKFVCLEMLKMPSVTGDGKRSVYELIGGKSRRSRPPPPRAKVAALVQYQGVSLDDVIPIGREVIVDFRYVSTLFPKSIKSSDVFAKYAGTEIARQFTEAGPVLWAGIPDDVRNGTLWTLDAMVEEDSGRVWFLEMNCNPMVHPDAYFSMLEGLFGPAEEVTVPVAVEAHPPVHAPAGAPAGLPGTLANGSQPAPIPPGNNGGMPPR